MSITQDLSAAGILMLAGGSTLITNLGTHPLCTLKNKYIIDRNFAFLRGVWNCHALHQKYTWQRNFSSMNLLLRRGGGLLYAGFSPVLIADFGSNTLSYFASDYLKTTRLKDAPYLSGLIAGLLSCCVIAPGEGVMINRQIHRMSMPDSIKKCITVSGLFATVLRDIPYTVAVLELAPAIEKMLPQENQEASRFIAGAAAGSVAGVLTVIPDAAKTYVQANKYTLRKSLKLVFRQFMEPKDRRQLLMIAGLRVGYLSCACAIQHLANRKLGNSLRRLQEE